MKKLILFITLILTFGLLPCWIQYGVFCTTTDFLNQQIGFILETKKMLSSGLPFWSWNTYFGQDFIASYSFYTVTSPFVWLNCLCPVEYMLYGITFTLYMKMICLGLLSFLYFRKMQIKEDIAIIGSLLFSFSSFVTISIGFYHFLEPIMCFPLVLWAIEKFLRNEKNSTLWLGLSVFATCFINFYFAPCTLLPALLYSCCRISSKDINISPKRIAIGVVATILGALMSSFILLPSVLYLAGGERAIRGSLISWQIADRIGSLFIPKVRDGEIPLLSETGTNSTAAYIAVLGILPAVIYAWRNKSWLSVVLATLLICYLTPLNGIFSLFTDVNYTRWAYALTFFIVLGAVLFLNEKMVLKGKHILLFAGATALVFLYRYFFLFWKPFRGYALENDEIGKNCLFILCLFVSCAFLLIYWRKQKPKVLLILVSLFSILQLACFTYLRSDAYCDTFRDDMVKKDLFNMYVKNNSLPLQNEQVIYRTDFITRQQPYYYSNVCLLKNTPSVCTYNSVRSNMITGLIHLVDAQNAHRPSSVLKDCNQPSFDCLMSVHDIVQYKDPLSTTETNIIGTKVEETIDFIRYKAKYYLPMGFTYNSYVLQDEIDRFKGKQDSVDVPLQLLANIAIQKEDEVVIAQHLQHGIVDLNVSLDSVWSARNKLTASNMVWSTTGLTCTVNIEQPRMLFFSMPAEKGLKAFVDGYETKIYNVNCGLCALLVTHGSHAIELYYTPQGLHIGLVLSFLSLVLMLLFNRFVKI